VRQAQAVALAPAKLNLGLEITGRRSDGYHELVTILQTVSIFDRFEWTSTDSPFLYRSPPEVDPDSDLVARALARHADTGQWTGTLRVEKCIPISAGLGGGSTDAALALALALPEASNTELEMIGASLGSDVPFFVRGGSALATGTGTTLEPLPTPPAWFVILTPHVALHAKTSQLYGSLSEGDFSSGRSVRESASRIIRGKELDQSFPNAFTRPLREYPDVRSAWRALERAGASSVNVSGAGPSLFAVAWSFRHAVGMAARIPPESGRVMVAHSIPQELAAFGSQTMASHLRGE
jgi:4-diphosphocytidyl-2-C-methyl-D-erythritol kinase